MSTRHPHIPQWIGSKPRVLLINRKDMVPEADRAAWSRFFAERGHSVQWTNGNLGDGVTRVRGSGSGPAPCMPALQPATLLPAHSAVPLSARNFAPELQRLFCVEVLFPLVLLPQSAPPRPAACHATGDGAGGGSGAQAQ